MARLLRTLSGWLGILCFGQSHVAEGEAAEEIMRAIKISAAYFDLVPFGEPVTVGGSVEARMLLSILPRLKSDLVNVDVPKAHGIPIAVAGCGLSNRLRLSGWFGTLFPGSEMIVRMRQKPQQWLFGESLHYCFAEGVWQSCLFSAVQHVQTEVGGIEAPLPSSVSIRSSQFLWGANISAEPWNAWGAISVGSKDTLIRISAAESSLVLEERDRLADAKIPLFFQISLGWKWPEKKLAIGFSELWMPERLWMPRFVVGWVSPLS